MATRQQSERFAPLLAPNPREISTLRRVLYWVGGIGCLLLGVVGWLVPIVTGIPFYIAGLFLLGMASRRMRIWINRTERRFPVRLRRLLRHRRRPEKLAGPEPTAAGEKSRDLDRESSKG